MGSPRAYTRAKWLVELTLIPSESGTFEIPVEVHDGANHKSDTKYMVKVGEPQLAIDSKGPSSVIVDRPATYTITVRNPGSMPAANVVVVTEVVEGMTLVSASPGSGTSGTSTRYDNKLKRNVNYQEVRWTLGELPPNSTCVVTITLKTAIPGSVLEHVAWATADHGVEVRANHRCGPRLKRPRG